MSWLFNYLTKKTVGPVVQQTLAAEDPYYEYVETTTSNGKVHRKRVRRDLPKGLSPNDARVLKTVRSRAWQLDLVFSLCGFRVGWTALIGIIPFVGDIINLYLGMALLRKCEQIDGGLPPRVKTHMLANIAIDFGLGFTPVVGAIAGAVYKSNSRNALLLDRYLRSKTLDAAPEPAPMHVTREMELESA